MPPVSPSSSSQCLYVLSRLEQAEFWASQNEPERARRAFLEAITRDSELKSRWEYARFLVRIDEQPVAIEQLISLWNEAKRRGELLLGIAACESLAAIYREQGEGALAQSFQQQAISAQVRSNSSGGFSVSELLAAANDAMMRGDLAFAEQLAACAVNGSSDEIDPVEAGDIWGTRGAIFLLTRDMTPAWRCFLKAYSLHCQGGDDEGRVGDLLNLAACCREEGWWELAQRLLVKARGIARRIDHRPLLRRAERFLEEAERVLAVALRVPKWN